jgi:hypothetical protein
LDNQINLFQLSIEKIIVVDRTRDHQRRDRLSWRRSWVWPHVGLSGREVPMELGLAIALAGGIPGAFNGFMVARVGLSPW